MKFQILHSNKSR